MGFGSIRVRIPVCFTELAAIYQTAAIELGKARTRKAERMVGGVYLVRHSRPIGVLCVGGRHGLARPNWLTQFSCPLPLSGTIREDAYRRANWPRTVRARQ